MAPAAVPLAPVGLVAVRLVAVGIGAVRLVAVGIGAIEIVAVRVAALPRLVLPWPVSLRGWVRRLLLGRRAPRIGPRSFLPVPLLVGEPGWIATASRGRV